MEGMCTVELSLVSDQRDLPRRYHSIIKSKYGGRGHKIRD